MQFAALARVSVLVHYASHREAAGIVPLARHTRQISLLSKLSRWALRNQKQDRGSQVGSPDSSALLAQSKVVALDHSRNALYYSAKASETFKAGRYIIIRKLGSGRYSHVWLAKDTQYVRRSPH